MKIEIDVTGLSRKEALEEFERELLRRWFDQERGNMKAVSERLKMSTPNVYRRADALGLDGFARALLRLQARNLTPGQLQRAKEALGPDAGRFLG